MNILKNPCVSFEILVLKISPPNFINIHLESSLNYLDNKKGQHPHIYTDIHPDNCLEHYIRHLYAEELSIKLF